MLKQLINEANITFKITAVGPLLIKDGETPEARKERKTREGTKSVDMLFVADQKKRIYLPGSSLKGVWRSWSEKIVITVGEPDFPLACDPFESKEPLYKSCSIRLEKAPKEKVYARSCPVCKLFGCSSHGSRIRFSDAYPSGAEIKTNTLPSRISVSIDRFSGGVNEGPFSYQYIQGKAFTTQITIRNFELWQLGLLAYLIRDFNQELVPMGFGKTRGFGRVKGEIEAMSVAYYGFTPPVVDDTNKTVEVAGISKLYKGTDKAKYGFNSEEESKTIKGVQFAEHKAETIKHVFELTATGIKSLYEKSSRFWAGLDNNKTQAGYFIEARESRKKIIGGDTNGDDRS